MIKPVIPVLRPVIPVITGVTPPHCQTYAYGDRLGLDELAVATGIGDWQMVATLAPDKAPALDAALLDVGAVAGLLGGCSQRHIYRLCNSGRMPRPIKLGALSRWNRAVIESWIADGCPWCRPRSGGKR